MPESLRGLELGSKAALTATAATLGSVIAHVAGGAPAPAVPIVLIAIALAVLVAVPLSRRAVSLPRLAAVIFAGQAIFHLFFLVSEPTSSTQVMSTVAGHEGHVMSTLSGSTPLLSEHALHLTPAMLVGHAIAGALTLLMLHSGERVLQRLVEAARDAWRSLRVLAAVFIEALPTRRPAAFSEWRAPAGFDDAILAWSGSRRGPPVLV